MHLVLCFSKLVEKSRLSVSGFSPLKKNMQADVPDSKLGKDAHGIKHLLKHHARALLAYFLKCSKAV